MRLEIFLNVTHDLRKMYTVHKRFKNFSEIFAVFARIQRGFRVQFFQTYIIKFTLTI